MTHLVAFDIGDLWGRRRGRIHRFWVSGCCDSKDAERRGRFLLRGRIGRVPLMTQTIQTWRRMEGKTLRESIGDALVDNGESFDDVVRMAVDPDALDVRHDGRPFTVWTSNRVYFPGVFEFDAWVASVPRHPCEERAQAVGG